jgi:hypothetical protein
VECWCCGCTSPEDRVVRLGNHPEVALCRRCAQFVHRRALEQAASERGGVGAAYRGAFAASREFVMRHELQHTPVIGTLFKRLNRLLP